MDRVITGLWWLAGAVIVALLGILLYACIEEGNEWQAFSAAHHCRVVGKMESSTAPGITMNGKFAMTFIPGKTGFQCDDGITYWRDN